MNSTTLKLRRIANTAPADISILALSKKLSHGADEVDRMLDSVNMTVQDMLEELPWHSPAQHEDGVACA